MGEGGGSTPFARFRVAVTPRKKNGQEWVDGETSIYDCTVFGQMAHNAVQSLKQGSRVFVKGRMTHRTYTVDGENRISNSVVVDHCGPDITWDAARHLPRQQQGQATPPRQAPQQAPQPAVQQDPWGGGGASAAPSYDQPPF